MDSLHGVVTRLGCTNKQPCLDSSKYLVSTPKCTAEIQF